VYGGGTIYKELYGSTGRLRHSVTLRMALFNLLARLFGAKIYHLHIGIGKINTWLGRLIARVGLKTATYTIFRDRQSYNFARQTLGIAKKRIGLSTDGLFLNRRWEKPWSKAELGINKKQYKTVVGINMLSDIPDFINRDRYIKTMRDLVNQLLAAELFVVLIPFQYRFNVNNDHAFMQQNIVPFIKRQHGWRLLPQVEIDEVSSVLAQCDVLIGMRFHSLLLATAVGTPFVAITYDTKCQRYVEEIAYPHHIKLEDATANRLQTQLAFVLHNKAALSKTVKSTADNYYKEVKQCLQYTPF
jgi:polysaccharide pyruvyl transferase WcaK-like protein